MKTRRMFRLALSASAAAFALAFSLSAAETGMPADRLDLVNFKLTLPIGPPEHPIEISQPALSTFKNADYFHLTEDRLGVVFRAHCGAVTTKGSGYPRCELREMTDRGVKDANWSTYQGTHRMFIRQAITHLPKRRPNVVAGQIHDAEDDVLVVRLEKRKLFIDHNGKDGPVLTKDYRLGDVFGIELVAADGRIKVYYNGEKTPVDDYPVRAAGCYFKAGCYTQSNVEKGDEPTAYGEVVIYELRIQHE